MAVNYQSLEAEMNKNKLVPLLLPVRMLVVRTSRTAATDGGNHLMIIFRPASSKIACGGLEDREVGDGGVASPLYLRSDICTHNLHWVLIPNMSQSKDNYYPSYPHPSATRPGHEILINAKKVETSTHRT